MIVITSFIEPELYTIEVLFFVYWEHWEIDQRFEYRNKLTKPFSEGVRQEFEEISRYFIIDMKICEVVLLQTMPPFLKNHSDGWRC